MNTQHLDGELVTAGVDWLTMTVLKEDATSLDLHTICVAQMQTEKGEPKEIAPQGFKGYQVGGVFIGSRDDRFMFRVSGDAARSVAQELHRHGITANCSRIDLQITFKRRRVHKDWAGELRTEIRSGRGGNGELPDITTATYESFGRGSSVSINSRRSPRFVRIYDKSAESRGKLGENLLRVELELKKAQAQAVFNMIANGAAQEDVARSLIIGFLDLKKIPHNFKMPESGYSLPSTVYETDEEKRVAWLLRDIAPCVKKVNNPALRRKLRIAFGF